jgi:hypothetical protein
MEKEKQPPERKPAEEPTPLRDDVQVAASRARCPFCRDEVAAEGTDWVACRGCLARHHVGCWGEHGACSACGESKFLPATPGRARTSTRPRALLIVAFIVALVVGGGLARSRAERAGDDRHAHGAPDDAERRLRRIGSCAEAFTRLETYRVHALNPVTLKVWDEPDRELYLDEYAELLAGMVLEGYTDLRGPSPEAAEKVIHQVHEQARTRYSNEEEPRLRRLQAALQALRAR